MRKRGQNFKPQASALVPVIMRPDTLPLLDPLFHWNQFESFVRYLIQLLPGVQTVKRYGKVGSKQKGIDLTAILSDGKRWAFQCKQYQNYKLAHAKKAFTKATYAADKYFLIIACQTDSTVHDYIESLKNWELWDAERISDEVLKLPPETARQLVSRFFGPNWCKAFLGIGSTSPFLPWKLFYTRWLNNNRLFNHNWQLVGRTDIVSSLNEFCSNKRKRVALLVGRGGIGKSKLLHAFAEQFSSHHASQLLWFVEENISLTQQSVDELPENPCVIVLDDAHRSENLKPLLAAAIHSRSEKKLLFSTRPQRLDFLKAEITQAGFDYTEIFEFPPLQHLNGDQVKQLARQALGPTLSHLDRQLADASWDCPLVTVVGGKLLADESIDPRLLESHEGFRAEVLNRFQDIIIGNIAAGVDSRFFADLLQVLSVTAPFMSGQNDFVKTVASFLAQTPEDVAKGISELEQAGVLLRRGRYLRVTPDVLSDHIVHQACVTADGRPTGYAEKIFASFANVHAEKVFLNLAELDWRIRITVKNRSILESIWKDLEAILIHGTPEKRSRVMELVKETAYYQPHQALHMVETVLKHLPTQIPRKFNPLNVSWSTIILRSLPEILRRTSFTLECVPQSARILWELGKSDSRQQNQYPEHAFRILKELAAYHPDKPLSFYNCLLDVIVGWLKNPSIHDYEHSVIDILDHFLAKTGEHTESDGNTISWGRFPVDRKRTAHLREKAFKAICSCADTGKQKVILRVIKSIQLVLHSGMQIELGRVSAKDLHQWKPDQLAAIKAVENIITGTTDPIIQYACLCVLSDRPHFEQSGLIKQEMQRVSKLVTQTFDLRLICAFARNDNLSWRKLDPDFKTAHEMYEARLKQFHKEAACELQAKYPSAAKALRVLDKFIGQLRLSDIPLYETQFLLVLAENNPTYTYALCAAILSTPQSKLSGNFHFFLGTVEAVQPKKALGYAQRAVLTRNEVLCWAVASYLDWMAQKRGLSDEEYLLLGRLLCSTEARVVSNALSAVKSVGRVDSDLGLQLLSKAKWEQNTNLASTALSSINPDFGIQPDKISKHYFRILLKRLEKTPDIGHWGIDSFIGYASQHCPLEVVKLLIKRIKKSAKKRYSFEERPIPFEFHHPLPDLSKLARGSNTLRKIRDMTLSRYWQCSQFGRELFWLLGPFDFCFEVLKEWLQSTDERKFEKALSLLSESESDFVFSLPKVVESIFESAERNEFLRLDKAKSALLFCATRHGESRTIGQPGPTTLATRQRAIDLGKNYPSGSMMANFYESIVKRSDARLENERLRDEELGE